MMHEADYQRKQVRESNNKRDSKNADRQQMQHRFRQVKSEDLTNCKYRIEGLTYDTPEHTCRLSLRWCYCFSCTVIAFFFFFRWKLKLTVKQLICDSSRSVQCNPSPRDTFKLKSSWIWRQFTSVCKIDVELPMNFKNYVEVTTNTSYICTCVNI